VLSISPVHSSKAQVTLFRGGIVPIRPRMNPVHSTIDIYLSLIASMADCVGAACPPVGTPYRHRLERLHSRLVYEHSPEAVEDSTKLVRAELADYSHQAAAYLERHGVDLRRAIEELFATVRALGIKQDLHCGQLRQTIMQMQTAVYPDDAAQFREVISLHAAGLQRSVNDLSHDWQALLIRMKVELEDAERSIAEAESTDPITGLMNRREMERQIDAEKAKGCTPALIVVTVNLGLPDDVVQQVASRLTGQFRGNDLVARWSGNEFMVLFRSTPEIARSRAAQIPAWLRGRYLADNGDPVQVWAAGEVTEYELALSL
jgi:GGDEF domain-containing protein